MVVPAIIIDTSDLMSQYTSLTKKNVDDMMDNIAKGIAARYAQELEQNAQKKLHQTASRYIRNIRLIDTGKLQGTVMLDYSKDKLIKMLEEGASAFDMKPYFLNSTKAHVSKNGKKYLTIPLRWATPGAAATADVFAGTMPTEIYNVVKKAETNIPVAGGGSRSSGMTLDQIPQQFRVKQTRKEVTDAGGKTLFKGYQHKNSLYEGMTKQKDPVTGQNKYNTFRRVSEDSDPDAWIHPGIEKYNLIQQTLSEFNIDNELSQQLDNELSKLGLI